jgi:hypothetical protein
VKTITVEVREDHLEQLARSKPMAAMAELIWNALDAEASEVRIEFIENELEGLECIRIVDNGTGLRYEDALIAFRNLGGSWKREGMRTQSKRLLHGKFGKGRFRAFTLGNQVRWLSRYASKEGVLEYEIAGDAARLGEFTVWNPRETDLDGTGMVVNIGTPLDSCGLLRGVKAREEVTAMFALYLRQYPGVRLVYDGVPIDPVNAEDKYTDYLLDEIVTEDGVRVNAALTVVEWNLPGKRGVCLCDENGFMLHNALPRLYFRGFSYTAYVKSAHLARLDREGLLQAADLVSDLRLILDAARAKLREHFALREAEKAQDVLSLWKEQEVYPYTEAPSNDNEMNERRIFDIYATHLNQIFPDFATLSVRNRRLMLALVSELVACEPTRVARVLDSIVDFPEDKEEEIRELVAEQH